MTTDDGTDGTDGTALRCEMIDAHHPDCECSICKAGQDPVCGKPAVGFTLSAEDLCRVCDSHASMAADDPGAYGELHYYTKDSESQ